MSYDIAQVKQTKEDTQSQSLWNRAMSYDGTNMTNVILTARLNPFGTGQCLTTLFRLSSVKLRMVSIPLEQGNVLRLSCV